jgi:hypothetical protein
MESKRFVPEISHILPGRIYLSGQHVINNENLRKLNIVNILYILETPVDYDSDYSLKHIALEDEYAICCVRWVALIL